MEAKENKDLGIIDRILGKIDEIFSRLEIFGPNIEAEFVGEMNETYTNYAFHHADHLGSASVTTNENGEIISDIRYYPYGDTRYEDANYEVKYKYNDKELDTETDLYYYGARYYDSAVGRWVSNDPLQKVELTQINGYAYVGNNPIVYIDPLGLARAYIFYGGNGKGKNKDYFKNKAQSRAQELNQQDTERKHNGEEVKYSDGVELVDGADFDSWESALTEGDGEGNAVEVGLIEFYGHGTKGSVMLNEQNDGSWAVIAKDKNIPFFNSNTDKLVTHLPNQNVADNTTIRLYSCHAASGENNIAQSFANHFNAPTLGARGGVSFKWFGYSNIPVVRSQYADDNGTRWGWLYPSYKARTSPFKRSYSVPNF